LGGSAGPAGCGSARRTFSTAPAPPASREPSPRSRHGRDRRLLPILLGVAALLIGAVVALASTGGGDDPSPSAKTTAGGDSARGGDGEASSPSRTTAPPAPEGAASQPTASAQNPSALDAQGYRLIQQGRYAEAVPIERRAVQGFRAGGDRSSTGYAYALFNLGTALNRSGNPGEAIPYLQERLRISNDRRGIVEKELSAAQQATGASGGGGDRPGKKPKGDEDDD